MLNFSVAIPTTLRPELTDLLRSVLKQTYLPKEILVIVNKRIITRKDITILDNLQNMPSVRILRERNIGAAFARNRALKEAKCAWVVFVDDDCLVPKTWLETLCKHLKKQKLMAARGRSVNRLPHNLFAVLEHYRNELLAKIAVYQKGASFYTTMFDTRNCVLNRHAMKHLGFEFDTQYPKALYEDMDLGRTLISKRIPIAFFPEWTVFHSARSNFASHCRREFRKGRNKYLFYRKWRRLNMIIDIAKNSKSHQGKLAYEEANRLKYERVKNYNQKFFPVVYKQLGAIRFFCFLFMLPVSNLIVKLGEWYERFNQRGIVHDEVSLSKVSWLKGLAR